MSVRLVRVPEGTAGNVAEIGGELFAAIDSDTPTAPLPTISY